MQRADQHPPNTTATAPPTAPTQQARRRRATRLRSRPQPRRQELAALAWQRLGACRQVDQNVFFAPDAPGEPRSDRRRRLVAAKRVCAQCPVLETCRTYAVENREEFGVWGGLSETERKDLIAARRRRADGGRAPAPADAPPALPPTIPAANRV
jgi:WhiB family redox-sensing transcriptional regulator